MSKRVAVVTGSARGIGFAIAKGLEEAGYAVVYSGSSGNFSSDGFFVKCDISLKEDRENLLSKTLEKFGRVDVLVNNAGVAPIVRKHILETDEESFERLMKINLEGTFFMCQLFANQMIAQVEKLDNYLPKIINIGSMSAYASSVERGEYCISKAGIAMTTQLFAHGLAEHGISVFEVRPGVIETDMTAGVHEKYQKLIEEGLTPIKRFGKPEDVAQVVSAICGDHFEFSTGQVFNVDGGFHFRRL